MKQETKADLIGLSRAYLGIAFWWTIHLGGLWRYIPPYY